MLDIRKNICKSVKEARKFYKIKQEDIANQWGIKREAYSRFETGKFEFNYSQIVSLCRILKISHNELFGYDEVKEDFIEI